MKDLGPQALTLCNDHSDQTGNCDTFLAGMQEVADIAAAETY